MFVTPVRALLARLPKNDLSLSAQLDITYGLLNARIRKRLRREELFNFSDLLRLARAIEDAFDEKLLSNPNSKSVSYTQAAQPTSTPVDGGKARPRAPETPGSPASAGSGAPAPVIRRSPAPPSCSTPPTPAVSTTKKTHPSCVYYKRFGHTRDQCRKLQDQLGEPKPFSNSAEVRNNNSASDKLREQNQSFYALDSRNNVRNPSLVTSPFSTKYSKNSNVVNTYSRHEPDIMLPFANNVGNNNNSSV
ncbi:unnamed protein product [Diatraea saccharalis]|uniref:Uncharacterized protein n=1 Tax=Diatraea saccharalis TaxID=40085 RepID=A0A9N9WKM2_9NEOP|nr:unnamed protein product [Diatraea saccharalis]